MIRSVASDALPDAEDSGPSRALAPAVALGCVLLPLVLVLAAVPVPAVPVCSVPPCTTEEPSSPPAPEPLSVLSEQLPLFMPLASYWIAWRRRWAAR